MKKKTKYLAFGLAASLALASCGDNDDGTGRIDAAGEGGAGGHITLGTTALGLGFNPLANTDDEWMNLIFEPLTAYDDDGTQHYRLIESIESQDNQEWTVTLRETTWSDGESVTSDDLMFTLGLIANPDTGAGQAGRIRIFEGLNDFGHAPDGEFEGLRQEDERTVVFTTKDPVDINVLENTFNYIRLLPAHVLEDMDPAGHTTHDFFVEPDVSSSPFTLQDAEAGQTFVFAARDEGHWEGSPNIDSLELRLLAGSNVVVQLSNGEIDAFYGEGGVSEQDIATLEGREDISVEFSDNTKLLRNLYINNEHIPVDIRHAMEHAINREQIVDAILPNSGIEEAGPYLQNSDWYDPDLTQHRYDPDEARTILESSDWDYTQPLELNVRADQQPVQDAADMIVNMLNDVGMNVSANPGEHATWVQDGRDANYDLWLNQIKFVPSDPDLSNNMSSTGGFAVSHYENPDIDELWEEGLYTAHPDERLEIYDRIQQIYWDDMPYIYLWSDMTPLMVNDRVDLEPKVFGYFNDVVDWQVVE